jgi:hypothetical protein
LLIISNKNGLADDVKRVVVINHNSTELRFSSPADPLSTRTPSPQLYRHILRMVRTCKSFHQPLVSDSANAHLGRAARKIAPDLINAPEYHHDQRASFVAFLASCA